VARNGGAFTWAATNARLALDLRPVAHFLHVGKAAGSAVKVGLKHAQGIAKYRLVQDQHWVRLPDIPETHHFFFCVRDPIDRYVSGFLHRELQGQPRFSVPWSEGEARAFARFPSPDALAVSLSAGGTDQVEAEAAMRAIQHVRSSYWDWFRDPDYFKSRADHILWIGRTESLDLKPLAVALGLERVELPTDPLQANVTPRPKPVLSDLARQNLREWFAMDYMFLELCDELNVGREWGDSANEDTDRNFVSRVMSQRPFALHNKDALALARDARNSHPPRWLPLHRSPSLRRRLGR
jgi:hypothetical protein